MRAVESTAYNGSACGESEIAGPRMSIGTLGANQTPSAPSAASPHNTMLSPQLQRSLIRLVPR